MKRKLHEVFEISKRKSRCWTEPSGYSDNSYQKKVLLDHFDKFEVFSSFECQNRPHVGPFKRTNCRVCSIRLRCPYNCNNSLVAAALLAIAFSTDNWITINVNRKELQKVSIESLSLFPSPCPLASSTNIITTNGRL